MKRVFITGIAGFIGYHLAKLLLEEGYSVIGVDNINDYYSVQLKYDRLAQLGLRKNGKNWESNNNRLTFFESNLSDKNKLKELFQSHQINCVVHMAAQAGVRYSLKNADAYVQSNLVEFVNLCEAVKDAKIGNFIFASSSSVYGNNIELPYTEKHSTSAPVSLYGATKKANEVIGHSYASLYGIRTSALRFFTVYGEWGRPDMAYFSFSDKIMEGSPIQIFNNGNLSRDFTYIGDIVKSIKLLVEKRNSDDGLSGFELFNIGNSNPVELKDFIHTLEHVLGKEAKKTYLEMQDGDVYHTYADTSKLEKFIGFSPEVPLHEGLKKFVTWYKDYYTKK